RHERRRRHEAPRGRGLRRAHAPPSPRKREGSQSARPRRRGQHAPQHRRPPEGVVSPALSLLILLGAESIALKEKATVPGRWVRVVDLIDLDRTDPATRAKIADIHVGRAPEEGQTRTIRAEEIRRELAIRGIDLGSAIWSGDSVEVSRGISADVESLKQT